MPERHNLNQSLSEELPSQDALRRGREYETQLIEGIDNPVAEDDEMGGEFLGTTQPSKPAYEVGSQKLPDVTMTKPSTRDQFQTGRGKK